MVTDGLLGMRWLPVTFTGVPVRRGDERDASPHGCVHSLRLAGFVGSAEGRNGNGGTAIWLVCGNKIITSDRRCNRARTPLVLTQWRGLRTTSTATGITA